MKRKPNRWPGWLKGVAVSLLAVFTWAVATDLPAKVNSWFEQGPKAIENIATWWKLDSNFTGTWTSDIEGWIGAPEEEERLQGGEEGPVAMRLRVYDGKVEGEISSTGLKKVWPFPYVMLQGVKSGSQLEVTAIDLMEGKLLAFAKFEIRHLSGDDQDFLSLRTVQQDLKFFPAEARLHRDEKAMSGASAISEQFLEYVKKSRQGK